MSLVGNFSMNNDREVAQTGVSSPSSTPNHHLEDRDRSGSASDVFSGASSTIGPAR